MTMKARFMVRQTAPRGAPGFVRIIGGKWRGRRVLVGASARPTPSRLRETIFNCVRDWENRRVLDLFAGSGALGLEAMSRGATKIVLVETDSGSLSRMRQTLRNFGAENSAELQIAQIDAVAFLREAAARGDTFDFIFIDAPYAFSAVAGDRVLLDASALLAAGGKIYFETGAALNPAPAGFSIFRQGLAGAVRWRILTRAKAAPPRPADSESASAEETK